MTRPSETDEVRRFCSGRGDGLCNVFAPHATVGLAMLGFGVWTSYQFLLLGLPALLWLVWRRPAVLRRAPLSVLARGYALVRDEAGAVVREDVPEGATAVGVPARILEKGVRVVSL